MVFTSTFVSLSAVAARSASTGLRSASTSAAAIPQRHIVQPICDERPAAAQLDDVTNVAAAQLDDVTNVAAAAQLDDVTNVAAPAQLDDVTNVAAAA